jgi:hypothetical protein
LPSAFQPTLRRANLDGSGQVTLVSGPTGSILGSTLDLAGGQMYWADGLAGAIRRANLDGSGQTTLVSGIPPDPHGMYPSVFPPALDLAHGQMYWCEIGSGSIRRANLDGTELTTLVSGLDAPTGVALDLAGGQMYWCDIGGEIRRANLDGTGQTTLLQGPLGPGEIALDIAGGKMYWNAIIDGTIVRANLDGSDQEILAANQNGPAGFALDIAAGKMYWTDVAGDDIRQANLDGTGQETMITVSAPGWIALDLGVPGTAAYIAIAVPASVPSGTSFDLTVTALDPYGNPAVNYQGTVIFSTSDTDPGIVLPADYTFTTEEGGVHTFSGGVTLNTPGDQTVTVTDTASGIMRTATVTVVPPN